MGGSGVVKLVEKRIMISRRSHRADIQQMRTQNKNIKEVKIKQRSN